MDSQKIDRVVGLLEDDHFRQGGYLDADQVLQLAQRHELSPEELVAVRTELAARDLIDDDPGDAELTAAQPQRASGSTDRRPEWTRRDESLLQRHLREVAKIDLLSPSDEVRLARRVRAGAEASEAFATASADSSAELRRLIDEGLSAKQEMVAANVRWVVTIAKRYAGRSLAIEDLVQEGTIGLVRAVERFDPNRGFRFITYATWWIRASITRALADKGRTIRIPVHAVELLRRVRKTRHALRHEYGGREPSLEEVAAHLGKDPTQIQFLIDAARTPTSLDRLTGDAGDQTLGDRVPSNSASPEEALLQREAAIAILHAIDGLPERERRILRLRYGLEDGEQHTLASIGLEYGVSRERIRQIEAKALEKLRQPTTGNPLRELLLARERAS